MSAWVVLCGLALASLPFLGRTLFMGIPVLKSPKSVIFHLFELSLCYGLWLLFSRQFEASQGQVKSQSWEFFAVTSLLFLVLAFPGFAWRFLWRRNSANF